MLLIFSPALGEVNISQESLQKFLTVAEELEIKGLTSASKSWAETLDQEECANNKKRACESPIKPNGNVKKAKTFAVKGRKISKKKSVL